jgi:RNA polymerase sigma-70 factor (ECF subfamily)
MTKHNRFIVVGGQDHSSRPQGESEETNPNAPEEAPANPLDPVDVETLYLRHQHSLSRYLKRLLPSEEDAEEVLQETYVRLLSQKSRADLDENSRSYLFAIALNLVRDMMRKRGRQEKYQHVPIDDEILISHDPTPDKQAEWSNSLAQLKQGLLSLNPRTRAIFMLHRFEEMTYPEIAQKLNISVKTVERHIQKAIQDLQDLLNEKE